MDCDYIRFHHYIDLDTENDYYDTTCASPNKCFTVCSANPNIKYRPKEIKKGREKEENISDTQSVPLSFCPCGKMPVYKYYKTQDSDGEREFISIQCSDPNCKKIQLNVAYPTAEMAKFDWNEEVQKYNFIKNLSGKLIPCKCGGKAKIIAENICDGYLYFICCDKCKKMLGASLSPYELVEKWNNTESQKKEENEA